MAEIDIGRTNTRIALIDEAYEIIQRMQFPIDVDNPYATFQKIQETVQSFSVAIVGVGLSCPDLLDSKQGIVLDTPNLKGGWHGPAVSKELSARLKVLVFPENDADLACLVEVVLDQGKGYFYVQFLTISTELGSGLVINKKIYQGAHGFAYEIASIPLWRSGPNRDSVYPGGVEAICSGTATTIRVKKAGLDVEHADDVYSLAYSQNQTAIDIMEDAKEYLADTTATIYAFVDPEIVTLGGSVTTKIPRFVEDVERRTRTRVYPNIQPLVKVAKTNLGEDSGLPGAAYLALLQAQKLQIQEASMKSEKENCYIKETLKILVQGDIVATGKIASMIAPSEEATRNKLERLQNYLQENQLGSIEKKPHVGIWLNMDEQRKEKMLRLLDGVEHFSIGYDATQWVRETLQIFSRMMPGETITIQRLAEELYLSPPTVLKVMKDCEKQLAPYDIEVNNERSRGCSLKYDETSYRVVLKDYIMLDHDLDETRRQAQDFFSSTDIDLIKKAIIETENEWNYRSTDTSFCEIFVYRCLAYQRKDFSTPPRIAQEDREILERYNEYPFTIAIFKKLHEKVHVIFSSEDVTLLATQILCSKFIGINNAVDTISNIPKYGQKILNFINEMLVTIGNILEVDLTNDSKLWKSLIFHMRPTIFRLRYGSPQSNSFVNFIKTEYKTVFRATWSIPMMFENAFGLQITEDELGYTVLYIQSALERRNQCYSAIPLVESNPGHAQLPNEWIRKIVPETSSLKIISRHDFKLYKYPDEDIIISPKLLKEIDRHIIVTPNPLSDTGIGMLYSFMDDLNLRVSEEINPFEPICFQLFSPELMFINTSFDTKEELLKYMCERMKLKGYVAGKFYNSVMEREKTTTTSIGNRVTLPHGTMSEVNGSHVAITVLPEPIAWDGDRVDVIFLLGFKMSTHEEIRRAQSFYKQHILLIETDEKVKTICSKKSNLGLCRYLMQQSTEVYAINMKICNVIS